MFVEMALVAALALALGYAWGLKRKPSASPPPIFQDFKLK